MTAAAERTVAPSPAAFPMEGFLDQLMAAESGGRQHAKNPRSTALGPFQFIESTFLAVVNKHFPSEVAGLSEQQVLALRTDLVFSRRAAAAYAHDLISALEDGGLPATTANVRLAFLVGPFATVRLLKTRPDRPLRKVLSAEAIAANPFMSGATVAMLIRKAAADITVPATAGRLESLEGEPAPAALGRGAAGTPAPAAAKPAVAVAAPKARPAGALAPASGEPSANAAAWNGEPAGIPVAAAGEPAVATPSDVAFGITCNVGLASCRRWIALQELKAQPPGHSAQW
jgi:hypothetical protein